MKILYAPIFVCLFVGRLHAQQLQFSGYAAYGTLLAADDVAEMESTFITVVNSTEELLFLEEFRSAQETRTTFAADSYWKLGVNAAVELNDHWQVYTGLRADRLLLEASTSVTTLSSESTGVTSTVAITPPPPSGSGCGFTPLQGSPEPPRIRQSRVGIPLGIRYSLVPGRTALFAEGTLSAALATANSGNRLDFTVNNSGCGQLRYVDLENDRYTANTIQGGAAAGLELWVVPGLYLAVSAEQWLTTPFFNVMNDSEFFTETARVARVRPLALQLTLRYAINAPPVD